MHMVHVISFFVLYEHVINKYVIILYHVTSIMLYMLNQYTNLFTGKEKGP